MKRACPLAIACSVLIMLCSAFTMFCAAAWPPDDPAVFAPALKPPTEAQQIRNYGTELLRELEAAFPPRELTIGPPPDNYGIYGTVLLRELAIPINPADWQPESRWSEYGPASYDHGRRYQSAWGRAVGSFVYRFSNPIVPAAKATITARLSSEFIGNGGGPSNGYSDVTLHLNGRTYKTHRVIPDNDKGRTYTWEVNGADLNTDNHLVFSVEEVSDYRNGIVIYPSSDYPKGTDEPIMVHVYADGEGVPIPIHIPYSSKGNVDWGETGWNLIGDVELWGAGVSADNLLVGLGTRSIDELAQIADDATTRVDLRISVQENKSQGRFRAVVELADYFINTAMRSSAGKWVPVSPTEYFRECFGITDDDAFAAGILYDERHAKDPFVDYLMVDPHGRIVAVPRLYDGDILYLKIWKDRLYSALFCPPDVDMDLHPPPISLARQVDADIEKQLCLLVKLQPSQFYTTPKHNYAIRLDGVDDYVQSEPTPIMNRFPLTIEAWVYPEPRSDQKGGYSVGSYGWMYPPNVVCNDSPSRGGHGFGLNMVVDGLELALEYHTSDRFRTTAIMPFEPNQWYHVAAVYESGSCRVYINGAPAKSDSYRQAPPDGVNFVRIGTHNNDSSWGAKRFFKGMIDEVRVWSVARSESEIRSTMDRELTGQEPGLELYYSFNEGSGQVVYDLSGHFLDGILYNGPQWVRIGPGNTTTSSAVTPTPLR